MTASILLRIVVLDSENHYIKNPRKVKHKFTKPEIFCENAHLAIFPFLFYTDKKVRQEELSWEKASTAP